MLVAVLPAVAALALRFAAAAHWARERADGRAAGRDARRRGRQAAHRVGARARAAGRRSGRSTSTAIVELIEPRATKGQRLTIRVTAMEKHEAHAWPARVRIRTLAETSALKPGDAVRVKATLSPPPGPSLPGDYDFARAAWFSGAGCRRLRHGRGRDRRRTPREPPLSLRLGAAIARVRQAIGQRVLQALPGETGAIANALITGERGGISEATNQAFRDSGLFHILSISGLHMVIMAGAVFLSIRLVLAAIPAIALRYPTKKWAAAGAMAGALAYLLISGAAFATVRSYIMISIMFLAVLLDRPALALRNVALAALLILLVWPESLLDAGFQMSFAAVVALGFGLRMAARARRGARGLDAPRRASRGRVLFFGGIVTSTLVAGLAVAPFGIYHFHNTQQFAILANLAAIPICNLLVMPAALASLLAMPLGLEAAPLWAMGLGIEAMVWCAQAVAALPGAVGRVPAMPTYAFASDRDGRAVVCPVADALAGAGRRADGARGHAGAYGAPAGRADRARRRARGSAWCRRQAFRACPPRLHVRAGALARARRRWAATVRGGQGGGLPLRQPGVHSAREGCAPGGDGRSGGPARRLRRGRHRRAEVCQAWRLQPVGSAHRSDRCGRTRGACADDRGWPGARRDGGRCAWATALGGRSKGERPAGAGGLERDRS